MGASAASTPIDDFLAGGASASGERWEVIGAGVGLGGVVLAVGLLVLLVRVHRGPRREVQTLLLLAAAAGAVMVVGGAVEIAGTARVLGVGWFDALTDGSASSAMMRLLGGVLLLLGLGDDTMPVGAEPDADDVDAPRRWAVGASSAFGIVGLALGVFSFAFDGHTISEGPRVVHAAVDVVHVAAGGVWFGGVVGLAVVAGGRRRSGASIGHLLESFARVATAALAAVFVAGVGLAIMILDELDELTGSDWGRRLIVKVAGVGIAALLGAYHHLIVVPRLVAGDAAGAVERLARRTLTVEAAVLTFAVVMSALLTRASIT